MIDRAVYIGIWAIVSLWGMGYAATHWNTVRHLWAGRVWKGHEFEANAYFHRKLAQGLLFYFAVNAAVTVGAVVGSSTLAPLLILANMRMLLLVRTLRRYEQLQREGRGRDFRGEER